ncbi:MAG: hypothetical protein R8G66_19950 [Cytophagales bacterium]|nr:hypothetical protein [Cytophagales bacterium]
MRTIRWLFLIFYMSTFLACTDQDQVAPLVPDDTTDTPVNDASTPEIEWVSSLDLSIAVSSSTSNEITSLTSGERDYKPVFSPDGTQVAFFRIVESRSNQPEDWDTQICVINVDGTGIKTLTSGEYTDWNPMWTRDGTNQVIFSRFFQRAPYTTRVYVVDPSGETEEELVSDDQYSEFAYSGLKDGRILVRRIQHTRANSYWLLTPEAETPAYQMLDYPDVFLHKMSISPNEDRVTYMKVVDGPNIYGDAVLAYADFDPEGLSISNEQVFTFHNPSDVVWYPCWNEEETHIIYSLISSANGGNGQIMAYELNNRTTSRLSRNSGRSYWYPNVKGVVK